MPGIATIDTAMSMKASGAPSFTELPLLMSVPELGGDPEKIDVTTLGDKVKKSVNGVRDLGDLQFKFLFDNTDATTSYRLLRSAQTSNSVNTYMISFPDGTSCTFDAEVSVKMDAAEVNNALTFTASMALQSDMEWDDPAED